MKYLLPIFESSKEKQLEDIQFIFSDYLDNKYMEGDDEVCDCYIDDRESDLYLLISISNYVSNPVINSVSDFDSIFKEKESSLQLLKNIKTTLLRLDYLGYKWGMSLNDDTYDIKVFYKDTKLVLLDAFSGESSFRKFDDNIIKIVLKRDYNINFHSCRYIPSTQGYYGSRAHLILSIDGNNSDKVRLIDDLTNLKSISGEILKKVFYRVESPQESYLKLTL